MFYCRDKELADMNRRYNEDRFECLAVYGRRRVGKTALVNEFCKDKPTIYFSAINGTLQDNLEGFSRAIFNYEYPDRIAVPVMQDFQTCLEHITELCGDKRLILFIDEYPYLAKADPSFSSRLQHIIDREWSKTKLFVILCGSSMSFMVNQVMGYESPLYGRRTGQYKIDPLGYKDTAVFAPELSTEDKALLYGITGGIPYYINELKVKDNIEQALINNFFNPSSYLYEEPENLLKQEMREPAMYNSIIKAIAGGASRLNDIATKVGIDSGVCSNYIKALLELGLVIKETPFEEKAGKKSTYLVADNFFRFWYRFVPQNLSIINFGRMPMLFDRIVKPYLHDFMGLVFEKMCKEYICSSDTLGLDILSVGQWWGTDSRKHKEVQIDIVAKIFNPDIDEYLIGSCKFRNEKIGIDELELLEEYAQVFGKGRSYKYIIFSKSGFKDNLLDAEKSGRVILRTLEDIYR